MLRDSICDEATNTELCRYVGGDCCLEIKDTSMCRNCSCMLSVNPDRLKQQFEELQIKPVRRSYDYHQYISDIVTVQEVVSDAVCAILCLEHEQEDSLNVWRYDNHTLVCSCGWIDSLLCPEFFVKPSWELRNIDNIVKYSAYIQLEKTTPCGIVRFCIR